MKLRFGGLDNILMFKDLKELSLNPKYGYNQEYVDSIKKEILEINEDDLNYISEDYGEFLIAKFNNVLAIYIKCLKFIYIYINKMKMDYGYNILIVKIIIVLKYLLTEKM